MKTILQASPQTEWTAQTARPTARWASLDMYLRENHKPSRCQIVVLGPAWFMV